MTTQKKTHRTTSDGQPDNLRFEQALERLEAIVEEMEAGDLDLETMITRFEEGRRHLKACAAKLDEVEKRIDKLVKKDGDVTVEPFEADAADDGVPPSETATTGDPAVSESSGELPF